MMLCCVVLFVFCFLLCQLLFVLCLCWVVVLVIVYFVVVGCVVQVDNVNQVVV